MSKEQKKEITKDERKKIIESMSDDDLERVQQQQEYNNSSTDNELIKSLLFSADQLYVQYEQVLMNIKKGIYNVASSVSVIRSNKREVLAGITRTDKDTGNIITEEDLDVENLHADWLSDAHTQQIRLELIKLFNFINRKRFDGTVILTEEQYEEILTNTMGELRELNKTLF